MLEDLRNCNICEIAREFMDETYKHASPEYQRERTLEEITRITEKRQCICHVGKEILKQYEDIRRRR